MAYPYYPQNYLSYPQAYPQAYPQQQPTSDMNWVQGEAGAKGYHISPNTTVTLWDSEAQTIYVKSANAVGVPTITILDYEIRNQKPAVENKEEKASYATADDIATLRKEIEQLKGRIERKEKKND